MMSSKKTIKATPKCNEMVSPNDPSVGIGLNTTPETSGFSHDEVFDAGDPPETTATTYKAKDSMFGCVVLGTTTST
jgi:hypothetical protein